MYRVVTPILANKSPVTAFFTLLSLIFVSTSLQANPGNIFTEDKPKAAYDYIGVTWTLNEFRSLTYDLAEVALDSDTGEFLGETIYDTVFYKTAQPYSISAVVGSYLNDYAKSELRFGYGVQSDTVEQTLDINLHYWIAWYMGLFYPITDYSNVYAQFGFTNFQADITRREAIREVPGDFGIPSPRRVQPSRVTLDDKVFGTSFSPTWLLGADFSLGHMLKINSGYVKDTYLAFEYGRLIRDTESNIKVYQANVMLRYEY